MPVITQNHDAKPHNGLRHPYSFLPPLYPHPQLPYGHPSRIDNRTVRPRQLCGTTACFNVSSAGMIEHTGRTSVMQGIAITGNFTSKFSGSLLL